ncbi:MAG: FIST N-terminal domain-containing protein [Chloroflexota bacterium]|nr:FIST C-terminal domain-containing protein [Dehalococcoidia bacterium]MDW8253767.1 FIST N-terminal domain-containing protein [Chloroflexota bacterium]
MTLERGTTLAAGSAIGEGSDWAAATDEAIRRAKAELGERPVDLALLFISAAWEAHAASILARVRAATGAAVLAGCSGQAIIGRRREVEDAPAISLLLLGLPGGTVWPAHVTQPDLAELELPIDWIRAVGAPRPAINAWLVFADPFRLDVEHLLERLAAAYPDTPIVGGLASGNPRTPATQVFLNDRVYREGAVLVGLGGAVTVQTVVAQGCQPIGRPWTITNAEGNVIAEIGGRPALDVLIETVQALSPEDQLRARRNLLVGLAIDEYRTEFERGDFLIRNLLGIDTRAGTIAIGAQPRIGQTIQFQLRDAAAADEDLRQLLDAARDRLSGELPVAALLCSCNGRGRDLFGVPDHDAQAVADHLAPVPLAGFFCNGEIGPIGGKPFLHGFTASLALFVPRSARS